MRSQSGSISSGSASEYEPGEERWRTPSASLTPDGSESSRSGSRSRARTGSGSPQRSPSPLPLTQADAHRYSTLVSNLAARDAADLAPRLAGTGVWSSQFWVPSLSAAPSPASSRPATPRTDRIETEDEEEVPEEDELDEDDPDEEDVPRFRPTSRPQLDLAELTSSRVPDPATRWPLHPIEIAVTTLPTGVALHECAERVIRTHRLALPRAEGSTNGTRRRRERIEREERLARRGIKMEEHDSADEAPGERTEVNHLPPRFAERVAATLDRTLASLAAFRPRLTVAQRAEAHMSWEAVVAGASMVVDRGAVERTEERLRHIFSDPLETPVSGSMLDVLTNATTDATSTRATNTPVAPVIPPLLKDLPMRLDLVDEATGPPRLSGRQLAAELYTLPPLRKSRKEYGTVYPRSAKDAAEREMVSKRYAAQLADAARREAEKEVRRAAKREKREMKARERKRRTRERAREWRAQKSSVPGSEQTH